MRIIPEEINDYFTKRNINNRLKKIFFGYILYHGGEATIFNEENIDSFWYKFIFTKFFKIQDDMEVKRENLEMYYDISGELNEIYGTKIMNNEYVDFKTLEQLYYITKDIKKNYFNLKVKKNL